MGVERDMNFSAFLRTLGFFSLIAVSINQASYGAERNQPISTICGTDVCGKLPANWKHETLVFKEFSIHEFRSRENGATALKEVLGMYEGSTFRTPEFNPGSTLTCNRADMTIIIGRSAGTDISGPLSHILIEKRGGSVPSISHIFSSVLDLK